MELVKSIKNRRSPRLFSDKKITSEMLDKLFEAASWAPSAYNEQPWKYFYSFKKDTNSFAKFVDCLVPFNQNWAKHSQVLILSVGNKFYKRNNKQNEYFLHDVGAANSYLALRAAELGFQVHQMAGFDIKKTIEHFNLDSEKEIPVTFIAVGYAATPDELTDEQVKEEFVERKRLPITEFVERL